MNHLVKLNPDIPLEREEMGYEFDHYNFKSLLDIETKKHTKNAEKSEISATDEPIRTQDDSFPQC